MIVPPGSSDTERLIAIADAAWRVEAALRQYSVTLIMTDPPLRPAALPDGRLAVTVDAWNAWAGVREEIRALVEAVRSADPRGAATYHCGIVAAPLGKSA